MSEIADAIGDRIVVANIALDRARSAWSGALVSLTGFIGLTLDTEQALGAIDGIGSIMHDRWEPRGWDIERGAALQVTPQTQARLNAWTIEGNEIIGNLQDIAKETDYQRLDRILVDTATETVRILATDPVGGFVEGGKFWARQAKRLIPDAVLNFEVADLFSGLNFVLLIIAVFAVVFLGGKFLL